MQSEPANDPFADIDASVDGDSIPEGWMRVELPKDFRTRIKNRIGQGECNSFIAKLIQTARQYTYTAKNGIVLRSSLSPDLTGNEQPYAKDGYDLLSKMSGFNLVDNLRIGAHGVGGTTAGSIPTNDAAPQINASYRLIKGPYKGYATFMDNHDYSIYVTTAIHEMIHLAGYAWNDEFLVKVLKDMGEVKQTSKRDPSDDFGDVVKKYCGGNK